MKILKKLLVRIILLILTAGIVCGSVVAVLGYLMYRDALKEQSLEDRVAEVQADPSYTTLAELPDIYLEAVVAVEDHRFQQHCGIDIIAIARATWNNIKSWSLREGGSTITQQLAKNLYFQRRCSWHSDWSRPTQRTKSWNCMSTQSISGTATTVSGMPVRATLGKSLGR